MQVRGNVTFFPVEGGAGYLSSWNGSFLAVLKSIVAIKPQLKALAKISVNIDIE